MKHPHHLKYGREYKKARKIILASNPTCYWCHIRPATTADHDPPVDTVTDMGLWRGQLRPACSKCNYSRGAIYGNKIRQAVRRSRKW
jgi:hypothetical protein